MTNGRWLSPLRGDQRARGGVAEAEGGAAPGSAALCRDAAVAVASTGVVRVHVFLVAGPG